jgi:hypothetical protein
LRTRSKPHFNEEDESADLGCRRRATRCIEIVAKNRHDRVPGAVRALDDADRRPWRASTPASMAFGRNVGVA